LGFCHVGSTGGFVYAAVALHQRADPVEGSPWRPWLQGSLLFALGLLLVISPWIWRNDAVTGEFFLTTRCTIPACSPNDLN
jgi:hypothetical protein